MNLQPFPQPIVGLTPDRQRGRTLSLLLAIVALLVLTLTTAQAQGGNSITSPKDKIRPKIGYSLC
jgi:hypothetical protein